MTESNVHRITTVARNTSTELSVRDDQVGWDDKQVAALRQLGIKPDVGNADLAVFFHYAKRTGLDPFARQIYMIGRWDNQMGREKQSIQTGIDGFRVIARRAADRAGVDYGMKETLWCGEDGKWRDVWLSKTPPSACKVVVIRNGQEFPAVALFEEYAARKRDGSLSGQWPSKPGIMIAKCAESLALRMAFPQDLSGIYSAEEMAQADNPAAANGHRVIEQSGPSPERLVADAGTADELRGLYRMFKAQGGVAESVFTAITERAAVLDTELPDTSSDSSDEPVDAVVVEDPPSIDWAAQIAACETIAATNTLFKAIRDAGQLDGDAKAAITARSAAIRKAAAQAKVSAAVPA